MAPEPTARNRAQPLAEDSVDHLSGRAMPALALASTHGGWWRVDTVPPPFERLVLYAYPLTGLPGVESPEGWDAIPGARGCTPEACGFRDHAVELAKRGAAVAGVSTQGTRYQREAAARLRLPFPLLSDVDHRLAEALSLPTFTVELPAAYDGGGRRRLLRRLTLVVHRGFVETVFYPIASPEHHAEEVLDYLRSRPGLSRSGVGDPLASP